MPLLDPPTNPELAPMGSHSLPDDYPTPRTTLRSRRREVPAWAWAVLALIVCVLVGTLLILRDDAEPERTESGAPVVTATPTAAPAADLPEGSFAGDGRVGDMVTYIVGTHGFQPGAYATTGALDPAHACRWEHLRFRTEGDIPRRVRGGQAVGPASATVEIGDVLNSQGCAPWAPVAEDK